MSANGMGWIFCAGLWLLAGCFQPPIERPQNEGDDEVGEVEDDTQSGEPGSDTGDTVAEMDTNHTETGDTDTLELEVDTAPTKNACGGDGPLTPGEPGTPCGACLDGSLVCDPAGDKNTTRCEGASGVNSCGGCGELAAVLGSECGECGQVACGSGGGTRCAEPSAGCDAPLTCEDLDCGLSQRACIGGDDNTDASCGECLPTWIEVGDRCVGQALAPAQLSATTDRDDAIGLVWAPSAHATGYKVFRCEGICEASSGAWAPLLPVAIAEVALPDTTALPAAAPSAPSVQASVDRPEDVTVSWSALASAQAPRYSYRVVAVGPSGESAPSAIAVGHLAERPIRRYEVEVEGIWQAAQGLAFVDTAAPAPTLVSGTVTASQGTFATHVQVAVSGWESRLGAPRDYRVRAVTDFGPGAASNAVIGRRTAGALEFLWERSADSAPTDFAALVGVTSTTFQDTGLPADGVVRYYRARLSAVGAETVTSAAVAGWRQPRPGVPQIAAVTTELADRVELQWAPVDGALAYHVYRDEVRLSSASGGACSGSPCVFADGGAPAPGAWSAPTGVVASNDLTTGVRVSWSPPARPLGASRTYRVSAINQSGESERSTPVAGWRAAAPLQGFEIHATVSGNTTNHTVGPETTNHLHAEAPMASFASAVLSATRGDHRAHVRLTLSGGTPLAVTVTYRVRGVLNGGTQGPWSAEVTGERASGPMSREWQHATASNSTTWTPIAAATCAYSATTCDDTSAPSSGTPRWYRVVLSAPGVNSLTTSPTDGWRLSFAIIAAGGGFSCAVTPSLPDGGRVWCWGDNSYGQLGRGHKLSSEPEARAVPNLEGVVELAAGRDHMLARKSDNTVYCWGSNFSRQCASSTLDGLPTPNLVGGVEASQIAAGGETSCVIAPDATVRCWGSNDQGQLGRNAGTFSSATVSSVLVDASNALSAVNRLSVGSNHACSVRSLGGEVWCWGLNADFQLGQTAPGDLSRVALKIPFVSNGTDVSAGETSTCIRDTGNGVRCFGSNSDGQLGNGTTGGATATPQIAINNGVSLVRVGYGFACARLMNSVPSGRVVCWGDNWAGQLGVGDNADRNVATLVADLGPISALAAGSYHACAISDGTPYCWGHNFYRQLGLGGGAAGNTNRQSPVATVLP